MIRDAVHAEWTKLRTVPATLWLFLTTIVLTIGLSIAASFAVSCSTATATATTCDLDPVRTSFTGAMLGAAVVAALGAVAIGGEYGDGLIRTSLTAMPRRLAGLAAKAVVVGAAILVAAIVSVVGSLFAGWAILPGRGFTAANGHALPSLTSEPVLRATVGTILYLGLIGLIALGMAYIVRDSTAAIGIMLGLLYVFPIAAQVVSDERWHKRLERLGPLTSGLSIQATKDLAKLPISPWAALGMVTLWAVGALVAGGAVLRLKDA